MNCGLVWRVREESNVTECRSRLSDQPVNAF